MHNLVLSRQEVRCSITQYQWLITVSSYSILVLVSKPMIIISFPGTTSMGRSRISNWSGRLLRLTDVDIGVNLAGDVFTVSADIDCWTIRSGRTPVQQSGRSNLREHRNSIIQDPGECQYKRNTQTPTILGVRGYGTFHGVYLRTTIGRSVQP